jgi:hypothetical protein
MAIAVFATFPEVFKYALPVALSCKVMLDPEPPTALPF